MQTDSCSKCSANVVLDLLRLAVCRSCGAWNHGEHIPCVWCVGFAVYVGDVPRSIALGVRVCVVFAIVLGFHGEGGYVSSWWGKVEIVLLVVIVGSSLGVAPCMSQHVYVVARHACVSQSLVMEWGCRSAASTWHVSLSPWTKCICDQGLLDPTWEVNNTLDFLLQATMVL